MGEPHFRIKHKLKRHGIVAFSSNYSLHGDMSARVMSVIESLVLAVEVYGIDEAFADLAGVSDDLEPLGRRIRALDYRNTGIPFGVGNLLREIEKVGSASKGLIAPFCCMR
jgi:DNA polymerase V